MTDEHIGLIGAFLFLIWLLRLLDHFWPDCPASKCGCVRIRWADHYVWRDVWRDMKRSAKCPECRVKIERLLRDNKPEVSGIAENGK